MARATLEVADIFRQHGAAYRQTHRLPRHQLRLMRAIEVCRTAALGGHVDQCGHCHQRLPSYNSCRNRHCPKCGSMARARWVQQRREHLLPVEYFHVVFTVPAVLYPLFWHNQRLLYDLLFRTSTDTLLTIARDPRHLGAEIGFFGILHTWGQNLLFHPHIHYVVPGGGLSPDHDRWIACRPGFFLPVRVLSALFRNRFLDALVKLHRQGQLQFFSDLTGLADPTAFAQWIAQVRATEWVVYAKPPFGGPGHVLDYLGRYTHRVAISNHRLISFHDGNVRFRWKDYRHRQRIRTMEIPADEFIRRFLLHSLPDRFQRIRYGGYLANCHRTGKLALIRQLLMVSITELLPQPSQLAALAPPPESLHRLCPACGVGILLRVEILAPIRWRPPLLDSS